MTGITKTASPDHVYRPEIDGLRALAILPVLLFHYRVMGFGGGFVGVDVFFVISGYLITQLIDADRNAGRFTFAHFYERRLRRIFPALFAMLAVVTAIAAIIMFPVDLVRYARSLCATAVFAANFEFWNETGYFDVIAEEKPLLHLWSIAVEEQFYLLFPAVLVILRGRRQEILAIGGIFVLSFGYALWAVAHDPTSAFYLLPARAWELMLGGLLALDTVPPLRSRAAKEILSALGVAMIAAAVFAYTSETPFPGLAALLPCLGTAFVIYGARGGLVGGVLSLSPLVFVGRISYSLYLWHWPLYVFLRYFRYRAPSSGEVVALIAASAALAALSYRFVEQPFRQGRLRLSGRTLFAVGGATMAVTALAASVLLIGDGFPARLGPAVRVILAEESDHEPGIDHCLGLTADDVRRGRLCRIGAKNVAPSFVLWGDSHADAMLPAIADIAVREGRAGLFAGGRSCPPLVGVTAPMGDCRPLNDAVLALVSHPEIREVVLDARWAKYAEGTTYGSEATGRIRLSDDRGGDPQNNHAVFARGLARTIAALNGKKIVIIASVPEIGWPVPAVLAREYLAGSTLLLPPDRTRFLARQHFARAALSGVAHDPNVSVIYPDAILCGSGLCRVSRDGVPLYRDEHHLSGYGARLLEPLIAPVL